MTVGLLSPVKKPSPHLIAASSFLKHIQPADAAKCQFPNPVRLPDGKEVFKPVEWSTEPLE